MVKISLEFRRTIKTGARTENFVFAEDGELLEPVYKERSRTEAHGKDHYEIGDDQIVYIVEYRKSNSGRQYLWVFVRNLETQDGQRFDRISPKEFPSFIAKFLDTNFPEWPYFVEH